MNKQYLVFPANEFGIQICTLEMFLTKEEAEIKYKNHIADFEPVIMFIVLDDRLVELKQHINENF